MTIGTGFGIGGELGLGLIAGGGDGMGIVDGSGSTSTRSISVICKSSMLFCDR